MRIFPVPIPRSNRDVARAACSRWAPNAYSMIVMMMDDYDNNDT